MHVSLPFFTSPFYCCCFFPMYRFQRACTLYGVSDVDLFQTTDLWDFKNIALVTQTIFAIGRAVCIWFLFFMKFFFIFLILTLKIFLFNLKRFHTSIRNKCCIIYFLFLFSSSDIQASRIPRTSSRTASSRREQTWILRGYTSVKWSNNRLASRHQPWCKSIWPKFRCFTQNYSWQINNCEWTVDH